MIWVRRQAIFRKFRIKPGRRWLGPARGIRFSGDLSDVDDFPHHLVKLGLNESEVNDMNDQFSSAQQIRKLAVVSKGGIVAA